MVQPAQRLCVLLRLAVLLNRSRSERANLDIDLHAKGRRIRLPTEPGWLDAHALTRCDLENEIAYLAAARFELSLETHE